jgi:hypothetical protein
MHATMAGAAAVGVHVEARTVEALLVSPSTSRSSIRVRARARARAGAGARARARAGAGARARARARVLVLAPEEDLEWLPSACQPPAGAPGRLHTRLACAEW